MSQTPRAVEWTVGIYNNEFELVKPLMYVKGTYEKAEEVCELLQHHHPKKIIMFDRV